MDGLLFQIPKQLNEYNICPTVLKTLVNTKHNYSESANKCTLCSYVNESWFVLVNINKKKFESVFDKLDQTIHLTDRTWYFPNAAKRDIPRVKYLLTKVSKKQSIN